MTFGSPRPYSGWYASGAGAWPQSRFPRIVLFAVFAVIGLMLPVGVGAAALVATGHRHGTYHVGECVVVASSAAGELHATKAGCDTDPSFTVAKMTDHAGGCAPTGYDNFRPPSADPATGRLCLVPNLVVGHCYQLGAAVGMWSLVNCAGAGPATVKVAERLDTNDAQACTSDNLLPARTYPAPARTYCLGLAT
jgi:hypothetical protein